MGAFEIIQHIAKNLQSYDTQYRTSKGYAAHFLVLFIFSFGVLARIQLGNAINYIEVTKL